MRGRQPPINRIAPSIAERSGQALGASALSTTSAGKPSLARQFGRRFGDAAYAFEELVAELGSAFALGHIGLVEATIEGHAAYLES